MRRPYLALALVSFSGLFLELLLIRWISTEVRIFAYFTNLVLLACFLGLGLGCFRGERRIRPLLVPIWLALLVIAVNHPPIKISGRSFVARLALGDQALPERTYGLQPVRHLTELLSAFEDAPVWYERTELREWSHRGRTGALALGLATLLVLFLLIAATFYPIGQLLGRAFNRCPAPLTAYSVNVAASLLGIWGFAALSFLLFLSPHLWFVVALAPLALVLGRAEGGGRFALATWVLFGLSTVLAAPDPEPVVVVWSPYQKLALHPLPPSSYGLLVNNVAYMWLADLSDEGLRLRVPPEELAEARRFNQYDLPFEFKPGVADMLILGAGGGNNAAGALRHDVARIDAVEIDPGIIALGRAYHPNQPYSDPRVRVVVDDARSFLGKTSDRYDLIVLALLDSHTLVSAYNNTRLDHYVYTKESFAELRRHLKDDGLLIVAFAIQRPWIGSRLHGLLVDTFHQEPIATQPSLTYAAAAHMFLASPRMDLLAARIRARPDLGRFLGEHGFAAGGAVRLTTDDWPYLYLETPRVPTLHLWVSALLLAGLVGLRQALFRRGERIDYAFFFLGAAFLLLEFQNISKAALLFGSTWLVNVFIITGILLLILAANAYVRWARVADPRAYTYWLLGSVLVLYVLPIASLNALPLPPRILVAGLLLNLPIFFAGIVFASLFARSARQGAALGSNLLGAAFGGLLESASYVTGIRSLLLVVFALYALAALFARRRSAAA